MTFIPSPKAYSAEEELIDKQVKQLRGKQAKLREQIKEKMHEQIETGAAIRQLNARKHVLQRRREGGVNQW